MAAIETNLIAVPTAAKLSPLKALGLLVGAMAMVAAYITLFGVLHNQEFYAGFLFLACWTLIDQGKMQRLPHSIFGSAFGLALGYALHVLTTGSLGATGGYLFGAFILLVVYCQIIGWLSLFVNATTMMFLTVVTIPHVQAHGDFGKTTVALGVGIVYFGLILGIAAWLSARGVRTDVTTIKA